MPFNLFNTGYVPPPRVKSGAGGGSATAPSVPSGPVAGGPGLANWIQTFTVPRAVLEFNVMRNDMHVSESPRYTVAGESLTMAWVFEGASSVSSPSVVAYKDGTLVTDTLFPTNSPTASGNAVTFSPLTGMVGGDTYVVVLSATVDGSTRVVKLVVKTAAASDE